MTMNAALSGRNVIYVETLVPESSFAFYAPPGTQMPLHCTAMGKLFLALSPDGPADLLSGTPMRRHTPNTVTDASAFPELLAEIKRRRYALDHEEYAMGVRCVAAPICSRAGHPVAAVSVTALASRLSREREATVIAKLCAACADISEALGYVPT